MVKITNFFHSMNKLIFFVAILACILFQNSSLAIHKECEALLTSPQIVVENNRLGGCYSCVAKIIETLKGESEDINSLLEIVGASPIQPNQVDLSEAKVLYLAKGTLTEDFHTVLLLNGFIYDPYHIASDEIYTPVPVEYFFSDEYPRKSNFEWVYEIPAIDYSTSVHLLHLGAFFSRFLMDPNFEKLNDSKKKSHQFTYNKFSKLISESMNDSRGLISKPMNLDQWLKSKKIELLDSE